jgi:hypothetical protein
MDVIKDGNIRRSAATAGLFGRSMTGLLGRSMAGDRERSRRDNIVGSCSNAMSGHHVGVSKTIEEANQRRNWNEAL